MDNNFYWPIYLFTTAISILINDDIAGVLMIMRIPACLDIQKIHKRIVLGVSIFVDL